MSNNVERLGRHGRSRASGIVLGFTVMAIGVILLLENLDLIRIHEFWRLWPLILVGIGLARLVDGPGLAGRMCGAVLAVVGGILLVGNLGYLPIDAGLVWPTLLIAVGVVLLIRDLDRDHRANRGCC